MFNGKDLAGWEQEGGKAIYKVEGDEVVGYTVADTPNSFLVSKKKYSDFILEYEMRLGLPSNSGVQIRSNVGDDGIVQGYQVEVDPTDRRFTGGLYDEKRRRWMYPLTRNEKGRDAWRNGDWNHFRVEANSPCIESAPALRPPCTNPRSSVRATCRVKPRLRPGVA